MESCKAGVGDVRRPGRPAGGGGQAKVISTEEFARVEQCLVATRFEHRDRAMFYLQYATGMRAGELAVLDVGDVFHGGRIRDQFKLGTEDTKYCIARTIYLENRKAAKILLAYLNARKPMLDYSGTEPLFTGQKLNHADMSFRLSANSVVQIFARMYSKAGIIGASSHSGRRWFMTALARNGVHPRVIQARAGHSSLATTQRYIEVTPDQERAAVRTIQF